MLEWDDFLARTKWAPIKDDSLVKKMFVANLCYTGHIIIMATFFFPFFFTFYSWNWLCWNALVGWFWKLCRASQLTTYFMFFWNRQISTTSAPHSVYSLARFGKTVIKCRLFAQNILVTWAHHTCLNSNIVRSACLLSRVLTQQHCKT